MGFLRVETRASAGRRKKLEQERAGQLFPSIPNEVSVNEIAAKFLTWKDLCVLSYVNRGWCQAIRSREVYKARLRSHSTETLSFGCGSVWSVKGIDEGSLQSMRNNYCYRFPLIPGFPQMPLPGCRILPLGERIFLLGGERAGIRWENRLGLYSNEVYVLDLAGQKQWKRCANMKHARGSFGGAALNGKIYVFGGRQYPYQKNGHRSHEPVCESEVYDPQRDTWTSLNAMPRCRYFHRVIKVGPELVMTGGYIFGPPQQGGVRKYETTRAFSLEVYHPGNDVWKVVYQGDPKRITYSQGLRRHYLGRTGYLSL